MSTAALVDLRLIETGDQVTVQDSTRNRATGPARRSVQPDGTTLLEVSVFGTALPVARTNRNGRLVGNPEAKVVAHQPPIEGLT